jgi:hypothetical protein
MPAFRLLVLAALAAALAGPAAAGPATGAPHNVVLFVADGLRSGIVTPQTAPALAELRDTGVDLRNSHAAFPTVTTVNASVLATGRAVGDTGDFGNNVFAGAPLPPPYGVAIAGLEENAVLGLMNDRFGGDYIGHRSLLQAARAKGYATAAVGKLGPVAIQDVASRDGAGALIVDDATGWPDDALPLPQDVITAIKAASLPAKAPDRGLNAWGGAYNMAGVQVANVDQQGWFAAVATRVLLPRFKAEGKPFVLVFWSRDPDGTQHNQGDSLNTLVPGINGPTTMAAIRNASDDLAALRKALRDLGMEADTDVVVVADHGFSTLSRQSRTSAAAKASYPDVVPGYLPQGFLAIDLAQALGLPLNDAAGLPVEVRKGFYPKKGALLGADPAKPQVAIASNGGSDLIYLPQGPDPALARRIVEALTRQDYTGGVFVRDDLGPIPGALPFSAIGLAGTPRTPQPAIVVSFASAHQGCDQPEICGVLVSDADQQQGQGTHGSLGRQDTHNFMAAIGPDFRRHWVDPAPVGNADIPVTLAAVLGLDLGPGPFAGRVLREALENGGEPVAAARAVLRSEPAANGFVTVLQSQGYDGAQYLDAGGAPGRTVGLAP